MSSTDDTTQFATINALKRRLNTLEENVYKAKDIDIPTTSPSWVHRPKMTNRRNINSRLSTAIMKNMFLLDVLSDDWLRSAIALKT